MSNQQATAGFFDSARVKLLVQMADQAQTAELIRAFKASSQKIVEAQAVQTPDDAIAKIRDEQFNAICIDLFGSAGVAVELSLVGRIREQFPYVPICLIGNKANFETWTGVSANWRAKFQHYYKIILDAPREARDDQIDTVAMLFLADAIKMAGFEHYQTLAVDFELKPGSSSGSWNKLVAVGSVLLGLFAGLIGPQVVGVEDRTCLSLQSVYSDRVSCTGAQPGYFWHLGKRVSALHIDGYEPKGLPVRCEATTGTADAVGEIALSGRAALTAAMVFKKGGFTSGSGALSPDPDAGIFEVTCRRIARHKLLTWWSID